MILVMVFMVFIMVMIFMVFIMISTMMGYGAEV